MTYGTPGTLVVGRPLSPARTKWLRLAVRMATAGWTLCLAACGGSAVDGTDARDEGDGSADRPANDVVLDDGVELDELTPDTADVARPPLYGVCVPGRQRCSADDRYVEVCSGQGQWEPFADCEALRWRLPESGLLWECGGGVGSGTSASCHQCAGTPGQAGCALGFCGFGGVGVYPPPLPGFISRCDDEGATLTLYAGGLSPMCPREIPYPEVCESTPEWDMWCRAPCACTEGVYEVRDSRGAVATTVTYGSCGDAFIGRPDYWADDVTREAAARLLPQLQNVDRTCDAAGTFPYMYGSCAVVGSGYCIGDEHCAAGERCDTSSAVGSPSAFAMGLDYPHCE